MHWCLVSRTVREFGTVLPEPFGHEVQSIVKGLWRILSCARVRCCGTMTCFTSLTGERSCTLVLCLGQFEAELVDVMDTLQRAMSIFEKETAKNFAFLQRRIVTRSMNSVVAALTAVVVR